MHGSVKTKSRLLIGASLAAIAVSTPFAALAMGQPAPDAAPAETTAVEEVVVTGSRITTGFQTPTPVTVASADDLRASSPTNLADALTELPVFSGGQRTTTPATTNVGGTTAQNLLSLRGLGPARTLVLLDGRRLPATNASGSTDVNILPQGLVSRVDVVTGGASAAYGSDAVAGVVNFILDTKLEGFKAEVQGGVSSRNDLGSQGVSLAMGHGFAANRGHVIFGLDYFGQDGKGTTEKADRAWFDHPPGVIPNPVVGASPAFLVIPEIRSAVGTYGGLISSGPLRGTQFLAGGVPAPFTYGAISGNTYASGGDGARANVGLLPNQTRLSTFTRAQYDLTDRLMLYGEASFAYSHTMLPSLMNQQTGAAAQYTIYQDNAYLPASIRNQMIAANIQSFNLGRFESDLPIIENESIGRVYRGTVGLDGSLGGSWKFRSSYTQSRSRQELRQNNLTIARPLYASADAVVNPATGQVVCRSTLMGYDPGCVPRNLFGPQPYNQAVADYVTGSNVFYLNLRQDVVAVDISGDLGDKLQFGAGPISVAMGVEYRKEQARQTTDSLSPTINDFTGVRGAPASLVGRQGPYRFGNWLPFRGAYDIKEGFIEVGVPLLKDAPFAKALDVSLAARYADYSTAGGVTPWKFGVNYQVTDDVRLRFTRSRDIRAANVLELFNPASQVNNNQVYQGRTTQTLTVTSGNQALDPEVAATTTGGVVYRPSWLPGLQLSLDYFKIRLNGAITTLSSQRVIDECAAGNAARCAQITVTPSNTLVIQITPINLNVQETEGYDFEAGYTRPVGPGQLSLRLLANTRTKDYSVSPGSAPLSTLGSVQSPDFKATLSARYVTDRWSVFVQERYLPKLRIDPTRADHITINDNEAPALGYTDMEATWKTQVAGRKTEFFFAVRNVFDQQPPTSPSSPTTFTLPPADLYDRIGRYFNAGIRFQM